jgi:hypothetical protein
VPSSAREKRFGRVALCKCVRKLVCCQPGLCEVYIRNAFACTHGMDRKHASLPQMQPGAVGMHIMIVTGAAACRLYQTCAEVVAWLSIVVSVIAKDNVCQIVQPVQHFTLG